MTRTTSVLIILALALGLFIYFNTDAREQAQETWQDTRTFFVEVYANVSTSLKDLFSSGEGASKNERNVQSGKEGESPGMAFDTSTFLMSLRQLWLEISSRFEAGAS